MREIISLNGNWKLKCMDPYVPLRDKAMETGRNLWGVTGWIDANVPGGVAPAMYDAGFIEYPYSGMNSLKCEWMEHRWWVYRKIIKFSYKPGTRVKLRFEGVDYKCLVYANHVKLGEHEGMYADFAFDITDICKNSNELQIDCLIFSIPDEMGQIGWTSLSSTQKARFGYKWDFSTHMVNLGIWQGVQLEVADNAVLDSKTLLTDVQPDGTGIVSLSGTISEMVKGQHYTVSISLAYGKEEVASVQTEVTAGRYSAELKVANPLLWYPNGMGAQPLYSVTAMLLNGNIACDTWTAMCGIRHIEYQQNEGGPTDARPYTIVINGKRVYIKGVNLVPADHVYGDVTDAHREMILTRAAQMHVNTVRVWGGGIIETESFYNICDRLGILVWQEFIQSSSGIDNVPSVNGHFLTLLHQTATHALKTRRNHTSLMVWSGGNELTKPDFSPADESDQNIAMLAGLAARLDTTHQFLPTSPSGPEFGISDIPDQSHDVHGDWVYRGNPDQYTYFGASDSLLHSEFGCDGMSCLHTAVRILGSEQSPQRMKENDLWRFHGDWWCTWDRDHKIFGHTDKLDEYIRLSQWMQAEGLRFILEANRKRLPRNSGSIIWQLNEPWPNLSCTALMDYYMVPKMAYYYAMEAFAPVHTSLSYQSLDHAPGSRFTGDLTICADSTVPAGIAHIKASVCGLDGTIYDEQQFICAFAPDKATNAGTLSFTVPDTAKDLFLVRLTTEINNKETVNDYWFSNTADKPYHAAIGLAGAQLEYDVTGCSENGCTVVIRNTGNVAALHTEVYDVNDEFLLSHDRNFVTILPGENTCINVSWQPRFNLPFDKFEIKHKVPELALGAVGIDHPVRIRL